MKLKGLILLFTLVFSYIQVAVAEENEYGIVKAWFNGKNATVQTIEGVKLKIGEPIEVKVDVASKISGNVYIKLYEPGVTNAYKVINGPSAIGNTIPNSGISSGWSNTYTWTLTPNGAWKNGNAPINLFITFSKQGDQKEIEFTIANPYILDEQYSGAAQTPQPTATAPGATAPKAAPFPSALGAIAMFLVVWLWKRR